MVETPEPMYEPPLLRFMRAMDKDAKEAFAKAAGTKYSYLLQLIGQADPNPNLKLAMGLVAESARLHRLGLVDAPPLSLQDLLVGRIKTQHVEDHHTGEVNALLPNGKLARRRVDEKGRIVLIDSHGVVMAIEDSDPSKRALHKVPPLERATPADRKPTKR